MTHSEAVQHIKRLRRIADLRISDIDTWLALLEDELQSAIPNSQLLARFQQIKADREKMTGTDGVSAPSEGEETQLVSSYRDLIKAVCERLDSEPPQKEELSEEIDRIILKGYFKSIYFRTVIGGLALVLLLVTGVEGYRLSEQVKAMQKLVDDARQQVEQGRVEVAKASSDMKERQAQFALYLLEDNKQMTELRTKAIQQMDTEGESFRNRVDGKAAYWAKQLDEDGKEADARVQGAGNAAKNAIDGEAKQQADVFAKLVEQKKGVLQEQLTSTVAKLGAAKSPWVPMAIWSMERVWVLLAFGLVVSGLGVINTFATYRKAQSASMRVISSLNASILIVVLALLGFFVWKV
jgi:hypothetical protein